MNTVYCENWLNNDLPDKCAKLIIADPPYYKVKGEFDFIWKTFDDYLADVEKWAVECKRVLADNGTLFWYGSSKRIAYSQIILDKYFNLINSLVWEKAETNGLFGSTGNEQMRSFPNSTERILMYSNEIGMTGLEMITEEFIKPRNPFSLYLRDEFKKAKVTSKEIAKLFPSRTGGLTGCVSNWLNGDSVITEEQYLTIREYLNNEYLRKEYEELRAEYEELRAEYEELRRPFNNTTKSTEVFKFRFETSDYDHDTVKPEKLTEALITTCTRKGDLVVVPFAGSGTECAMSAKNGRPFVGYDIEKKYVEMANKRCYWILRQGSLF